MPGHIAHLSADQAEVEIPCSIHLTKERLTDALLFPHSGCPRNSAAEDDAVAWLACAGVGDILAMVKDVILANGEDNVTNYEVGLRIEKAALQAVERFWADLRFEKGFS